MLTDKALGHVIVRNSALNERAAAASIWADESQDQDRHGHETEEEDRK